MTRSGVPSAPLPGPPPLDAASPAGTPWGPSPEAEDFWAPAPPARASAESQVATLATSAVALLVVFAATGAVRYGVISACVLAGAVVVGIAVGSERVFAKLPGVVAGIMAMLLWTVVTAFLGAQGVVLPPISLLLVGLVFGGLDWGKVDRLRAPVFLSGLLVVLAAGWKRGWVLPAALGWLVLALATLWSLEQDRRAALDHPRPLQPAEGGDAHPVDLLRVIGLILAISFLAIFLIGEPSLGGVHGPSCMPHLRSPSGRSTGTGTGRPAFRDPQTGDRVHFDPSGRGVGPNGHQYRYYDDDDGHPVVVEYDRNGREVNRYRYDGNGEWRRVEPGQPPPPKPKTNRHWPNPFWLLLPIALVAGAYLLWRATRPEDPDRDLAWALKLVAEIEEAGRVRGRPRLTSETVVEHTAALAGSVLPDPRLVDVGRVLSSALFDRVDVPPYTQLWAQSTVTEILAAHPPVRPGRRSTTSP